MVIERITADRAPARATAERDSTSYFVFILFHSRKILTRCQSMQRYGTGGLILSKVNGTMPRYKAKRPHAADVPSQVFTISAFCQAHHISEPYYYRLRERGLGPREMRLGRKVLISNDAAADWRRAREVSR